MLFSGKRQSLRLMIFSLFFAFLLIVTFPQKSEACCSCTLTAAITELEAWHMPVTGTSPRITDFLTSEFTAHRLWFIQTLWEDNILPALQGMSGQMGAVAMHQLMIVGTFLDAKHQLETQQIFEKVRAKAHKDYHPSHKYGMCEIGSNAKSLAASDRKSEFNSVVLSQRAQDRHLGNAYTAASSGDSTDKASRLEQFRLKFCDPMDNNDGLGYICAHDQDGNPGSMGATEPERMNKDIDFVRTVDFPWTLNIDFTDTDLTNHEEEVMALASNLYGHKVFKRPTFTNRSSQGGGSQSEGDDFTTMKRLYLDTRSILAKRSVAENSFNAITSMKGEGLPGAREYMLGLLEQLGIPNDPTETNGQPTEAEKLLGIDFGKPEEKIEPSYYAQMEILTKKIYQNPDFYTHLYDTPANVSRKHVAMQAIGLMQKFDLFKSYLRSEASLSVLLELAIMDLQEEIEEEIKKEDSSNPSKPNKSAQN